MSCLKTTKSDIDMFKKVAFLLILPCIYVMSLYAARPFNTDDARVVAKGHCQMETWIELHAQGDSELWSLPSCNLIWGTEITLGGMIGLQSNSVQFQLKKLFVDADEKDWGIGIAVGNIHNYLFGADNANEIYAYIPATFLFLDSKIALHVNVGYNLQSFMEGIYTLGVGLETEIVSRLYAIGEVYYSRFDPVMYQVGLRTWLVQDMLQLDATYGNAFYGGLDFVSFGLRILPPKFL
ncbi:hypothetical protein LS77_005245 [Helicobacter bilis]|uniref:Outer membrane beta-barrel protein n=3 Tax=Helicobacteraceae TaxID=72293 RepID=A0A6D2C710_9HELI|nr:hypothetical protein C826_01459 [Helicobacter bilis WiWa]TLE04779.1 hypothetical protein LS77_005245 [Helicobacter bilis]TLE06048.1 hypothetical protein LS76_004220 [Helicobacter bilis]